MLNICTPYPPDRRAGEVARQRVRLAGESLGVGEATLSHRQQRCSLEVECPKQRLTAFGGQLPVALGGYPRSHQVTSRDLTVEHLGDRLVLRLRITCGARHVGRLAGQRQVPAERLRRPRRAREGDDRQLHDSSVAGCPRCYQGVLTECSRGVVSPGEGQRPSRCRLEPHVGQLVAAQRQGVAEQPGRSHAVAEVAPCRLFVDERCGDTSLVVPGALGEVVSLESPALGSGDVAAAHRHLGEAQHQVEAVLTSDRQRRLEEASRVVVGDRSRRGVGSQGRRLDSSMGVDQGHRRDQVDGELRTRPIPSLESDGDREVMVSALGASQPIVDRASNQLMGESEFAGAIVADDARPDGVLQRRDRCAHRDSRRSGQEAGIEVRSDHRCQLEQIASGLFEAIEAGSNNFAHALRAGDVLEVACDRPSTVVTPEVSGLDEVTPQLDEQEGIAVGLAGEDVDDRV